ncbi:DUF4871 domain-containing protein [Bacillus mangrovi]|uniref:DUF4871 domain-containing protein n=1 Tax=Metabacillus mangrovi TaxID=1491830 RepID=A0A7X2S921_9BACI|nr:DUF4871 domain-containing protein [Metabacillus mangrovi]MTH54966.1 DUF4871 domain-containing protein [Metabacillus mangrovi]
MQKRFMLLLIVFALTACQSEKTVQVEKWKDTSPVFTSEYGEMFGKEGRIGIIGSKAITENGQKWMWHFWGDDAISDKGWEVKAFRHGEEEPINPVTFKDEILIPRGDEIHGHARSGILFPESGLWKLKVYIDGEFFDEMVVGIEQE